MIKDMFLYLELRKIIMIIKILFFVFIMNRNVVMVKRVEDNYKE